MSSVVVLRSVQGVPQFSLEVLCDGTPCCAMSLYDRSTVDTVVRFMSKSSGVLLFRLRNLSTKGSKYFTVSKANLRPDEKWNESKVSPAVNKVNILRCGESFDLVRDKTTGCAINLELLKDQGGRVLKDKDVEEKGLARTKWRLQVAPTDDGYGKDLDLSRGTWTIHNLLANDLPIVLNMNGGTVSTLDLKRGISTARDVKNSLGHLLGNKDQLHFKGCILQDNDILSNRDVTAFSTLEVCKPPPFTYPIYVKTLTGKVVILNVQGNILVSELKKLWEEKEGVPVDQQRFVFKGRQLEDWRTLREYGIKEESTLHCILRLRGGGTGPVDELSVNTVQHEADCGAQPRSRAPVLTVGRGLNVDPRNLAVGKIVPGKELKEETTSKCLLQPLMNNAIYLQFEIYIDCE